MKVKEVFYLLIVISEVLYANNPIKGFQMDINAEKRREEQEKIRQLQLESKEDKGNEYPLHEIDSQSSNQGLTINKILVFGNTVISKSDIKNIGNSYIGKHGGVNIINFLKELENLYLKKGYIAARVKVDMQKTDFEKGIIVYRVFEGKIEKITFKNPEIYDRQRIFFSFPNSVGDVVNITDLDQGIDNLNSISSNNAKFDLIAGEEIGGTIIEVDNQKRKRISGNFNYNNLGQRATGTERAKISLTVDDFLGFNDSLTAGYQRKLGVERGEKYNENLFFSYRLPFKYWEFLISRDESEYISKIKAFNTKYKSIGISRNVNIGARRIIHRDNESKTDAGLTLINKNIKNYIEDIKLETGSRKLSILKFDLNNQRKFLTGILYSNLAYYEGIDRLGAESDKGKDEDIPKAQFQKYTTDINWYKPFRIKEQEFAYRLGVSGQYSDDILYSSEKIGIGDDTTVRGFKDNSIMGDKGFYVRNEFSYKYKIFEPFIAYDIGKVKNVYKSEFCSGSSEEMSGASIGLRAYYKDFIGSITYSKPLIAPNYIEKNPQEVYISLSYSF